MPDQSSHLPITIRCDSDDMKKLLVQGEVVKFSDVLRTSCPDKLQYIDISATDKVLIDASLTSTEGFQLNIVAPNWEIIGLQKIILDGKKGKPCSPQKVKNGKPGSPGLPGGAAGNFYGVGVNFINGENLTVSVNGGPGGPGQDGGNGMAGKAGKDADSESIVEIDDGRRFFGTSSREYLVSGGPGETGNNGEDGGKGGFGGPSGEVRILNLGRDKIHGINILNTDGEDGPPGKGGLAGSGGLNGKNCQVEVTKSYAFWIEYGKHRSVTCLKSNVTAPSGLVGRSGAIGQERSPKNIPQALSETMLNYQMFIFKNMPESKELWNTLSSHPLVMEEYHLMDIIRELQLLEEEDASKSVYEFLLDQFYLYIDNHRSQIDNNLLNLVYFAIKSKLRLMEPKILSYGIFNTVEYLKASAERLQSLKDIDKDLSKNVWFNDNDYYGLKENMKDLDKVGNDSEFIYRFTKTYAEGLLTLDPHTIEPLFKIVKFEETLGSLKRLIEDNVKQSNYWEAINKHLISRSWVGLIQLNQKMIYHFQDVQGIADIYKRIQLYEDQIMLGQILLNENELGRIIRLNVVMDQYQMAENAVKQLKFPFAKHFLGKFHLPNSLQIKNDLDYLISNSKEKIETLANDLKLDEAVLTKFDEVGHNLGLNYDYPIYVWNKTNWENEINDLLFGKEVRLTADLTDLKNFKRIKPEYGIKFNEIKIKFVTSDKDQQELNEILKNFTVRLIHTGNSYYQCGEEYYVIAGEELIIEYGYGNPYENLVSEKLKKSDAFLSPYTTWVIKLFAPTNSDFERLKNFAGHVDVNLLASIHQFSDDFGECQEKNSKAIKEYYMVVNDITEIQNSLETRKVKRTISSNNESKKCLSQSKKVHKGKVNANYFGVNNLEIDSDKCRKVGRSIGYENLEANTPATSSASFDLNSNLMLGQLLINKIFGTTFQRPVCLSPEQEHLIKVRELESQILPFLKKASES